MKSDNEGILIINSDQGEAHVRVEENQILADTKGMAIINQSDHVLQLHVEGNQHVTGFTFIQEGAGALEVEGTHDEVKRNNNPDGIYLFEDAASPLGE